MLGGAGVLKMFYTKIEYLWEPNYSHIVISFNLNEIYIKKK